VEDGRSLRVERQSLALRLDGQQASALYGCAGAVKSFSVLSHSTTSPLTHHRHAVGHLRTMLRSCVISMTAMPVFFLEAFQQGQQLRLHRHVHRRRRLVGDQEVGLVGERHRDHHPLPLPAGKLMRISIEALRQLRQPHQPQQLDHPQPRLRGRHALVQEQHFGDLLFDGVKRVQ